MKDSFAEAIKKHAQVIELELLDPAMNEAETLAGCELALSHYLPSISVKPCYVHCAVASSGSVPLGISTVVGYPHGANTKYTKIAEVKRALTEGASELATVLNAGHLRDGNEPALRDEINAINGLIRMNDAVSNVIILCNSLSLPQILTATHIVMETGADWLTLLSAASSLEDYLSIIDAVNQVTDNSIRISAMCHKFIPQRLDDLLDVGCSRVGIPLKALIDQSKRGNYSDFL